MVTWVSSLSQYEREGFFYVEAPDQKLVHLLKVLRYLVVPLQDVHLLNLFAKFFKWVKFLIYHWDRASGLLPRKLVHVQSLGHKCTRKDRLLYQAHKMEWSQCPAHRYFRLLRRQSHFYKLQLVLVHHHVELVDLLLWPALVLHLIQTLLLTLVQVQIYLQDLLAGRVTGQSKFSLQDFNCLLVDFLGLLVLLYKL